MNIKWFSDASTTSDARPTPAPTPSFKLELLNKQRYGKFFVNMVKYRDCKANEGNKVLVTTFEIKSGMIVDPHFDGTPGIVARFPPTLAGWVHATRFAELISKDR